MSTLRGNFTVWAARLNLTLLTSITAAIVVGIAFIYSASSIREADALRRLYLMHAQVGVVGIIIILAISMIDYRRILRLSWVFYAIGVVLLVATLIFAEPQMGARRWIGGIQPAEIAKMATVILLAHFLGNRSTPRDWRIYLLAIAITALPIILIVRQPDLGTALIFLPTLFAMLFVGRIAPRAVVATLLIASVALAVFIGVLIAAERENASPALQKHVRRVIPLNNYQRERLLVFLFPDRDPFGRGWNKRQSEIAVGSGGVWGKGYLKGDQNLLGYLPASVASNDFIFSVLAEETGFAGSLVILLLFAGIIVPTLAVAYMCTDGAGRLLCTGVATITFCHMVVNIGMTVGLLPVTGLPLPFISYGRTFLLTMAAAYGLVQSVAVHGRDKTPQFSGE